MSEIKTLETTDLEELTSLGKQAMEVFLNIKD
jgi:hypothetical protein